MSQTPEVIWEECRSVRILETMIILKCRLADGSLDQSLRELNQRWLKQLCQLQDPWEKKREGHDAQTKEF